MKTKIFFISILALMAMTFLSCNQQEKNDTRTSKRNC